LTPDQAAYILGTMFAAGAHTAAAGMTKFLFAMVTHPWEWRALRKEMDVVVGGGGDGEDDEEKTRMPCFDDVPHLPRLRAAVKETLRWRPLPPDGVPHRVTEDDVVVLENVLRSETTTTGNRKDAAGGEKAAAEPGIFIPSGSLIQPIAWAIHRDPEVYPRGKEFLPERWLDDPQGEFPRTRLPEGKSLQEYPNLKNFSVFGYGRRICPGFNIVERSLVIQAALLVWGCEVRSLEAEDRGKGFVKADGRGLGNNDDDDNDDDDDEDVFPPFELKVRGERYAEIIARAAEKAEREDLLR
jgi:cytochrome P450